MSDSGNAPSEFLLSDYTTFKAVVQNVGIIGNNSHVIGKQPAVIVNVTENDANTSETILMISNMRGWVKCEPTGVLA